MILGHHHQEEDFQGTRVDELTKGITKPLKRSQWLSQPFPYIKDEPKAQRKERRELYLYQRSLPAPIPYVVLHGSHTKINAESTHRRWWFVNAEGLVMGRLATQIARVIMGKHKPIFDPSYVMGDYVVVVNCEKVKFTGRKLDQKLYTYHTGYPGGLVQVPLKRMLAEKPVEVLRRAVSGMLPRNLLRRERLKLLRLFVGPEHPHASEKPEPLPSFLQVPSPWIIPKAAVGKVEDQPTWEVLRDADGNVLPAVFGEDGKPMQELVDNYGNKWDAALAELAIEHGGLMFDEPGTKGGLINPFPSYPADYVPPTPDSASAAAAPPGKPAAGAGKVSVPPPGKPAAGGKKS